MLFLFVWLFTSWSSSSSWIFWIFFVFYVFVFACAFAPPNRNSNRTNPNRMTNCWTNTSANVFDFHSWFCSWIERDRWIWIWGPIRHLDVHHNSAQNLIRPDPLVASDRMMSPNFDFLHLLPIVFCACRLWTNFVAVFLWSMAPHPQSFLAGFDLYKTMIGIEVKLKWFNSNK